ERPHHFFFPEVLRHLHAIDESLSPRVEERWLAGVGPTQFHGVVGPRRNRQLLLVVSIEVPEYEIERAVWIPDPSLKVRDDALSRVEVDVRELGRFGRRWRSLRSLRVQIHCSSHH